MYQYIKYNQNNEKQIASAERKKAKFENKGYILTHTFINSITDEVTLTYATNHKAWQS